jgi:DNA-directed RNA polymerase subunit RPC12/RpoP
MIAVKCARCKKDFKISGTDFDERRAAGIKIVCQVCSTLPPKTKTNFKKVEKKEKK